MSARVLPYQFYRRDDVVRISMDLIGKVLCTRVDGDPLTSGIITETEAYSGRNDKACHARSGRRTDRTEVMYHAGGKAYVYLCYGIHHLFNIVTNREGLADAILIRAVKPVDGISKMLERREADRPTPALTGGPGRLSRAMGITTDLYGADLTGNTLWVEDRGISLSEQDITSTTRVGIDYAEEDTDLPWRFCLKDSSWVSHAP